MIKITSIFAFRIILLGMMLVSFIPDGFSQVTLTNVTMTGGNINMTIPTLTAQSVGSNSTGISIQPSNSPNRQVSSNLPNPSMTLNLTLNYFNATKADFKTINGLPQNTYMNFSTTTLYKLYVNGSSSLNRTTGQLIWFPTTAQDRGNVTNGTDINPIFASN